MRKLYSAESIAFQTHATWFAKAITFWEERNTAQIKLFLN